MKINPIINPNILKAYNKSSASKVSQKNVTSSLDEVSISKEAMSFAKTMAEIKGAEAVPSKERLAKVQDIKARIENGTYEVSPEDVADKIIADILSRYED